MKTKTILLIENELSIRELLQLCLEDLGGWNVLTVDSPLTGLEKAIIELPDAIIIDLSMPGMDGFLFMEQLRHNPVTQIIPVVLLSNKPGWIAVETLQKYQIVGTISKPFDVIMLSNQIATLLGWDFHPELLISQQL